MIKKVYLIFFICVLYACSGNGNKNYLNINGYDNFRWNKNVEEVKQIINEKYSGNLFEYFTLDEKNHVSYHFHSGNFFNTEVELWDAEFNKEKFASLKIYFKPKKNNLEIFNSISKKLENDKIKFGEKKKTSLFCTFYDQTSEKPVTKLILETQKIKDIEVVVLTLINLN